MRYGLRKHVLAKPPEKARLLVEIWAEAGRNPRVAADDAGNRRRSAARAWSNLSMRRRPRARRRPRLNSRFGARFFVTFVAGLFKQIAIEDDFDPEAETPMAIGVLKALLAGALSPDPAPGGEAR